MDCPMIFGWRRVELLRGECALEGKLINEIINAMATFTAKIILKVERASDGSGIRVNSNHLPVRVVHDELPIPEHYQIQSH